MQTLAIAWVALLAALPVMLLIGALTWADLGRPIWFRQRRAGRNGVDFELIKFRTMRDTRDAAGQPLPDDQRVGRIGRFLRRTRLDELPELLNIIRGEMALVGPRPLLPETVSGFGALGRLRGQVPPGLTGWAQVNGNTLLSGEEKLQLDLWYVENRTFLLDISILCRTSLVVLGGEKRNSHNLEKAIASCSNRGS
jgi:lipopolysaccharide/colanic/teichoic acid biosynthesis glycosyltransferase